MISLSDVSTSQGNDRRRLYDRRTDPRVDALRRPARNFYFISFMIKKKRFPRGKGARRFNWRMVARPFLRDIGRNWSIEDRRIIYHGMIVVSRPRIFR